jgi:hypothetical protein
MNSSGTGNNIEYVDVDGVLRSMVDSQGRPLSTNPEGIALFWREHGDTLLSDCYGRPMTMFHGTSAQFDAFREGPCYFTAMREWAENYAKNHSEAFGGEPRIVEAFLRLSSPAVVDTDYIEYAGYEESEVAAQIARGHDGLVNDSLSEVLVFSSAQIVTISKSPSPAVRRQRRP